MPRVKLSDQDVIEIRKFVDEGWTSIWAGYQGAAIARAYGVSFGTVSLVGRRCHRVAVPEAEDSPFFG